LLNKNLVHKNKLTQHSIAVIGNTTCPITDLYKTTLQFEALEFLLTRYAAAPSPFQMCPLPLFAEIVKTNHLRMRSTECGSFEVQGLFTEACEILERIHTFSASQWAKSKSASVDDWALVGEIYQAAVALFCILSLQSSTVLPTNHALRAQCNKHGQKLQLLLSQGLTLLKLKRFLIWPLVVLGVEAVCGGVAMRTFVSTQLVELSRYVGTQVPQTAKRVLEAFWASGLTRWDHCFDRPYVFTTQIAIDLSGMLELT
jgi:hypothetical protein